MTPTGGKSRTGEGARGAAARREAATATERRTGAAALAGVQANWRNAEEGSGSVRGAAETGDTYPSATQRVKASSKRPVAIILSCTQYARVPTGRAHFGEGMTGCARQEF